VAPGALGPPTTPVLPVPLNWHLNEQLVEAISDAERAAEILCSDLHLVVDCVDANKVFDLSDYSGPGYASLLGYGKGFIKKQKCGPDAWIQMALQLAYFRDQGVFALTYESASTRLFNEGRTETIRSASMASKEMVLLMQDANSKAAEKIAALRRACNYHQATAREASCGRGVDRHLFALYVTQASLQREESPFLKDALSMQYKLSTSQIPQRQTDFILRPHGTVPMVSPSGGFGPVSDRGYGVAYMMADDDRTFFHVSSKHSCATTDSERFLAHIKSALNDFRMLFASQ